MSTNDVERQDPPYDYSKRVLPRTMPDFAAMSRYELTDCTHWLQFARSHAEGMYEAACKESGNRNKRASPAEVMEVAQKLWDDPELRAIFERTGRYGNCTRDERFAVSEFLDAQHVGKHFNTLASDFKMAEAIVRRVISGELPAVTSDQTLIFVEKRQPLLWAPGPMDIIDMAYAYFNEPILMADLHNLGRFNSDFDAPEFIAYAGSRYDERGYRARFWHRTQQISLAEIVAEKAYSGEFSDVLCEESLHWLRTLDAWNYYDPLEIERNKKMPEYINGDYDPETGILQFFDRDA